jgi:ribosomal protein L20A (L18A)
MLAIAATQEVGVGGLLTKVSPRQKWETLTEKITNEKKTRGVDKMVDHLPSKHKH